MTRRGRKADAQRRQACTQCGRHSGERDLRWPLYNSYWGWRLVCDPCSSNIDSARNLVWRGETTLAEVRREIQETLACFRTPIADPARAEHAWQDDGGLEACRKHIAEMVTYLQGMLAALPTKW